MIESTKISALAIVLNEEDNIREYLKNMSFADEIIVVDSYSTDNTLSIIAAEFEHVKIFQRVFDDFSQQKNYAIGLASNDWIVFFDADERITEKGTQEIKRTVQTQPKNNAFWVRRIFYFENKPLHYGGKNQDKAVRLFRKSKCQYSDKLVHEQLVVDGKTGVLDEIIHHYSYKNKADFLTKRLQYSRLKAQELFALNEKPNPLHFYLKPAFRFFKHYILEFGILNGQNGITLAKIMAHHVRMRYVFLNEMYQNANEKFVKNKNVNSFTIGYEAKRIFHNGTGLGNYSRDLIRILSHFYPENNYLLYNPKPQKKQYFKANLVNVFEKLPNLWLNKKMYNLWRQFSIIRDLKKDNITLFHGLSGELPTGLKRANIKSVVTIHDLIFMRYPKFYSFFDRKIHYFKFKKAAHDADVVIAISEQTKQDIVSFLKIEPTKIKVVYQGCQSVFKTLYTEEQKLEVAQKYHLPSNFVLNIGTIEARKNVLSVVKAIQNIETTLIIIGGTTAYFKEIKKYIREHQMTHKVIFLRGLESKELAIICQLASVFVYPSLFEGFGIPIIEALFSKTTVITSKGGVFPEAGGPDSIYVDPLNIEEMTEKIDLLLKNDALRNDIAEKGFKFVQKFNDTIISKEIMDIYQTLAL